MVEQVWKNVVGNRLPCTFLKDKVKFSIPQGCSMRLYDLELLLARVEETLGMMCSISAQFEEGKLVLLASFKKPVQEKTSKTQEE